MDKTLKNLYESAQHYKNNCEGKHLLFISYSKKNNKHNFIEVAFNKSNFLHLTGLKTSLTAKHFYNRCINNKISINDFTVSKKGISRLKLDILPTLLSFKGKHFTMIGDYNGNGIALKADKITGNEIGFLALSEDVNGNFFPRSIIKAKTNEYTIKDSHERILYICSKKFYENKYSNLLYTANPLKIEEYKIPQGIIQLLEHNLIPSNYTLKAAPSI